MTVGLAEFFIQQKKHEKKQLINWTSAQLKTSVLQKKAKLQRNQIRGFQQLGAGVKG